jgi:hypothetical protein
MGERESMWLLIGLGGAVVFVAACIIAAGAGLGVLMWAGL